MHVAQSMNENGNILNPLRVVAPKSRVRPDVVGRISILTTFTTLALQGGGRPKPHHIYAFMYHVTIPTRYRVGAGSVADSVARVIV